jgi:hypothetical protein
MPDPNRGGMFCKVTNIFTLKFDDSSLFHD